MLVERQDGGVRMVKAKIPHGWYTKEFREEAVRMVMDGGWDHPPLQSWA